MDDTRTDFSSYYDGYLDRTRVMYADDVLIETLTPESEDEVIELIRSTLRDYEEAGSVLASTFRRVDDLTGVYSKEGARYFVAKDMKRGGVCVGGAGIGSLHGLPPSEGLGEVRDLVVAENYRGHGLGTRLLKRCIEEGQRLNYKRLYLETTPQMQKAQKLFVRFGFRPVTQAQSEPQKPSEEETLPCYYILEDLSGESA